MREEVIFNGDVYRRYPRSSNPTHQKYYTKPGGKGFLHRHVWEHCNGPIPEGFHVHHIDGDCDNNSIENLDCLPAAEHFALHSKDRRDNGLSPRNLEHMHEMRRKAADWHRSDEGLEWHQKVSGQYLKQARETLKEKRRHQAENPKLVPCVECGDMFPSPTGHAKVCSQSCHSKRSRRRKRERSTEMRSETN